MLPKQSVVNVSQVFTVDKEELVEKIGSLAPERVEQILAGLDLLLTPRDID
ncbi:MAG TPA: type II toxin-antitoxin system PemK/MazF family toxin [Thermoanaerobaculia bacterium]|nr:type II toxin-antitoxin system PemK/MazF family toxin [Thermoanaerobaculia bacterium]